MTFLSKNDYKIIETPILGLPKTNKNLTFNVYKHTNEKFKHSNVYDLYNNVNEVIDFQNKKILDFGGSFGNLIASSNGKIHENNYTCIDVDKEAIREGKKNFPSAQWIYYNAYNPVYNPNGIDILPKLEFYDIIFSYSVFTHTDYYIMDKFINHFKTKLNKNGKIYITFLSQQDNNRLDWYKNKRTIQYGDCDEFILNDTYFYLVDNKQLKIIPKSCNHLLTFYNDNFISKYGNVFESNLLQKILEVKN